MQILQRYIGVTIVLTTLVVSLVIIGLTLFILFVGELGKLGDGSYGLLQAFTYVLLRLPYDFYRFFPMAGLLGGLIGLGMLASHSELVVMRASGMSVFQISAAVIKAILVLTIIFTLLGELVAPTLLRFAETNRAMQRTGGQAVATQRGVWIRDGDSFIHINSVLDGGRLEGVSRYIFNNTHQMTMVGYAQSGVYQHGQWVLKNVEESHITEKGVQSEKLETKIWKGNVSPELLKVSAYDPEEMVLPKLYKYIRYRYANNLQASDYALTFWKRVFQPFATMVMMFLAIPFIFGPLRSKTMGLRIVTGAIVGFGFYILNEFFGPFSIVYQFPVILAAALPSVLFAILGLLYMRKVK